MNDSIHRPHQTPIDRHEVVERAESYLAARPADSVTIAQLCEVTGVSERTLRNSFCDLRGMSPKQYMLRSRLARVRKALKRREQPATITSIATDYGFYELGRFASRYKAVYGEHPSQTLRGSDAQARA
jgi:AraC family transcriptional regulator, ethanolamine operon transcriptional activator